jgi:hypothetical protein
MRILFPLALLMALSGCSSIMHELQPHRLWRWNYQESPGRTDDALFSIDDRLVPERCAFVASSFRP